MQQEQYIAVVCFRSLKNNCVIKGRYIDCTSYLAAREMDG
jgi:hypothetical protein